MEAEVSFGRWLQKRRKALDLTRAELAGRVGCSVSALHKIETDERRPSKQLAELLANAIAIPENERPTFLRIARRELSIERMKSRPPLPELSLFHTSQTFPKPIPIPPTPLIGRETELSALRQMLGEPQCRLITLVGPGGIGKTRLAMEVASNLAKDFAHGGTFVQLAGVNSPGLILPAIADALDLMFQGSMDPKSYLLNYLREKQTFLVVDNMEHLLDGAGLFAEILQHAPRVKILCTSREPLHLRGEWLFEVGSLIVPEHEDAGNLDDYSATALFIEITRRAVGGYQLTSRDLSAVVRICRLVDGMPLAIELAAAWTRTLACEEIAQEIKRNLDFLSLSTRDMPSRHRSMRAVFDHSWRLLSSEERKALVKLSVFRGGFTRESAQQVAGAPLELLSVLAAKSLLHRTGAGRYDQHELLRQYMFDKLLEFGEEEQARRRHLDYVLQLFEQADPELHGQNPKVWLDRLEAEHDNLWAALGWALEHEREAGLRLASTAVRFWHMRGHDAQGHTWLTKALESSGDASISTRAQAYLGTGWLGGWFDYWSPQREDLFQQSLSLFREVGDQRGLASAHLGIGWIRERRAEFVQAKQHLEEGLELYRKLGDKAGMAKALTYLGFLAKDLGNYDQAAAQFGESLALYREVGDRWETAEPLRHLGVVAQLHGDLSRAVVLLEESLALSQEIDDRMGRSYSLYDLARIMLAQNDYVRAAALFEESVSLSRELGEESWAAYPLCGLGLAALYQADLARAATLFAESLTLCQISKNNWGLAECFDGLAGVAAAQGEWARAACLFAAGEAVRKSQDLLKPPDERADYECRLAAVKAQLGEAAFAAMWADGCALTTEQAIDYALASL